MLVDISVRRCNVRTALLDDNDGCVTSARKPSPSGDFFDNVVRRDDGEWWETWLERELPMSTFNRGLDGFRETNG